MDHMQDQPARGQDKLAELIKDIKFGMFTTHKPHGGHLHSRPMTTQNKHIDDDSLWFFMSRSGDPVAEFEGDDQVNVSYADPGSLPARNERVLGARLDRRHDPPAWRRSSLRAARA